MKYTHYGILIIFLALIINTLVGCKEEVVKTPFFFEEGVTNSRYNIKYLFTEEKFEYSEITLEICKLMELENAILYSLIIPSTTDIPDDRLLLGYFYVDANKIFKLNLGYKETLRQEDFMDGKKMKEILKKAIIVCQDEAIADALDKHEKGWHYYIDVNGNKRGYRSYNNLVETGYYESFVWELGKGLVQYRSGFGAEAQSIELTLIGG